MKQFILNETKNFRLQLPQYSYINNKLATFRWYTVSILRHNTCHTWGWWRCIIEMSLVCFWKYMYHRSQFTGILLPITFSPSTSSFWILQHSYRPSLASMPCTICILLSTLNQSYQNELFFGPRATSPSRAMNLLTRLLRRSLITLTSTSNNN